MRTGESTTDAGWQHKFWKMNTSCDFAEQGRLNLSLQRVSEEANLHCRPRKGQTKSAESLLSGQKQAENSTVH
jgi:hypothetical protein